MNNTEHKWIEDRLDPGPTPEPPEGLLERIQEEIPHHLQIAPRPVDKSSGPWKMRLLAASFVVAVLSVAVVFQLSKSQFQDAPSLQESASGNQELREVPRSTAATKTKVPASSAVQDRAISVGDEKVAPSPAESPELDALASVADEKKADLQEGEAVRQEVGPGPSNEPAAVGMRILSLESGGRQDQDPRAQEELYQGEAIMAPPTEAGPRREQASHLKALGYVGGESQYEGSTAPSTGGTAEPNDAPYGDMFFRAYGTNPFIDTEDDPLSTFGLDVDTGSFTLARSYLDRGHLPPAEAIRVEEFVNYFDYHDPAPRRGEFTLIAEGAPSPFATGPRYQLVRFGIKAREIRVGQRQPALLIFVVDVSGSMRREDRLELVKRSLRLLLDQLDRLDRVGLVVYGSHGQILLEPTSNKDAIGRAIDRLSPGGSTNAEQGLDLAYDLARRYYRDGDINRLILCSDGVANVGRTGPDSILQRVRREADDGIELTTVGFGMGNYNDVLMEQLADQGDGAYSYVDSLDEARRIFVENLTGTLQTIASDAKVQVEFNPAIVSRYRLIGYENRDIADERFRDDTVDAGEIGAGHSVTALYEIKLKEGANRRQRLATLRLRYRSKDTDEVVETAIDLSKKNLAHSWEGSSVPLQLSSLAAEFAEILRGSYWAKDSDLDELYRRLRLVADRLAGDEAVQELLYLVDRARQLDIARADDFEE